GVRYIKNDRRLATTVFAKAAMFVIGPSWVIFTVMGEKTFPIRIHGMDAHRGAMLGMSLLMASRGVGALVGPFLSAPWAGHIQRRLQIAILVGLIADGLGYIALGFSSSIFLACLSVIFAHCGGSTVWVFSTTLLQLNADDRFRGRVFAADLGL